MPDMLRKVCMLTPVVQTWHLVCKKSVFGLSQSRLLFVSDLAVDCPRCSFLRFALSDYASLLASLGESSQLCEPESVCVLKRLLRHKQVHYLWITL